MKKIVLLLVAWCGLSIPHLIAQQQLSSTMSLQFSIPSGGGTYQPGDQITTNFTAFNNTSHDIWINPTFDLIFNNEVAYSIQPNKATATASVSTDGSFSFVVPSDCLLEAGAYQLKLTVTYSHDWQSSTVNTSTFDDLFDDICDELIIPTNQPGEEPGESPPCEIFAIDINLEDFPECCTYEPSINVSVTSFSVPPKRFSCRSRVEAAVTLSDDDGNPVAYTLEWSNGLTTHSFIHDCGNYEYFVTVFWMQNGQECSAISETVTATSMCGCQCDCPGGTGPVGGSGGGPIGPGGGGDNSSNPSNQSPEQLEVLDISSAQLFPNPNKGQFNLSIPADKIAVAVEVQNILGQRVLLLQNPPSNDLNIDLNQALIGTYLLNIKYVDGSAETHKFIIH